MEDHVHQAVQAAAEADHVHDVADHQAAHEAHAAEASHVVDAPNPNHQRVAAVPNPSELLGFFFIFIFCSSCLLILFSTIYHF